MSDDEHIFYSERVMKILKAALQGKSNISVEFVKKISAKIKTESPFSAEEKETINKLFIQVQHNEENPGADDLFDEISVYKSKLKELSQLAMENRTYIPKSFDFSQKILSGQILSEEEKRIFNNMYDESQEKVKNPPKNFVEVKIIPEEKEYCHYLSRSLSIIQAGKAGEIIIPSAFVPLFYQFVTKKRILDIFTATVDLLFAIQWEIAENCRKNTTYIKKLQDALSSMLEDTIMAETVTGTKFASEKDWKILDFLVSSIQNSTPPTPQNSTPPTPQNSTPPTPQNQVLDFVNKKHWKFPCTFVDGFKGVQKGVDGNLILVSQKQESEIIFIGDNGDVVFIPWTNFITVESISVKEGGLLKKENQMIKIQCTDMDGDECYPIFDVKDKQMNEIESKFSKLKDGNLHHKKVYYKINNEITSTEIDGQNPEMQEYEEVLWSFNHTKGIFRNKTVLLEIITNFRIFTYDPENNVLLSLLFIDSLDDAIVENRRRRSSSDRVGVFSGMSKNGVYGGMSMSHSEGTSRTVGDLRFMKNGRTFMKFFSVTDPESVRRLVLSIKKHMYPKKDIQDFLEVNSTTKQDILKSPKSLTKTKSSKKIKDDKCDKCEHVNPSNAKFCLNCGNKLIPICSKCQTENPKNTSFCGNCGFTLE
jgi:hypothetical protein